MAKKSYAACSSKEEKLDAISRARSVAQLDEMWGVWEKQGFSAEGLLYAAVLDKKVALGGTLSSKDTKRRSEAVIKRKAGAALPPITGNIKL